MLIYWLVDGIKKDIGGGFTSSLASNRYRAIIPASQLLRDGHAVELIPMTMSAGELEKLTPPDVFVVGKLLLNNDPMRFERLALNVLDSVASASGRGTTTVADFSDNHFDNHQVGAYWRALAAQADVCTAASDAMAHEVQRHSRGPVFTVVDPLASPASVPRVFRRRQGLSAWSRQLLSGSASLHRLKLVWYGNKVNWPSMKRWAEALGKFAATQPLMIWVVTQPDPIIENYIRHFNERYQPTALMELVAWNESTQWSVVADADVVLLPSDLSTNTKTVKSANRLTDAVNAGRYVVASPIPAYQAFSSYVTLTEDPVEAIREYLAQPAKAFEKLSAGQAVVRSHHSSSQVATQWLRAFRLKGTGINDSSGPHPAIGLAPEIERAPLVRLNLGCGDKILPGYVNVDVVESRAGKSPDVLCDLHDLSCFKNDHADEIMAIHVVEHFWRWEIEDILREWLRVLKPGGTMILECPNLLSACEALLAEPETRSRADKAGQKSMWVFYGDPGWKDPLMIHRWGYTPYSLGQLMQTIGLVNVRQEPAVYKLKEPRDMRLVGEKPVLGLSNSGGE